MIEIAAVSLAATITLGYGAGPSPGAAWRQVAYRGRTRYEVQRDSSGAFVRAEARGTHSALFHPIGRDVRGATLRWRWRAHRHPAGADTRARATDDRTAAVFVMVRRSLLPWRTKGLIYQWAAGDSLGVWRRSPYARDIHVLTLRNEPAGSAWREESRDLAGDLAAAFGEVPERIEAIGVLGDADNTGDAAVADIGELELHWSGVTPAPPRPRP